MARASLAPGFIRLFYSATVSSVAFVHSMNLGILPAAWNGAATTITRKNAGTVLWTTALEELTTLFLPLYHTTSTFIGADLWRQDTPTSDPVFVASHSLNDAGSSATSTKSAVQTLFAFRGTDDSGLRLTLLESISTADQRLTYAGMGASAQAVVDYVAGATTWLYTRGNSFPVTVGFLTTKVNDKIRKKRMAL